MTFDIEKMRQDRKLGTPGPWMSGHFADDTHSCNCRSILGEHGGFGAIATIEVDNELDIREGGNDAPDLKQSQANSRRIASVPDMEAEIERLTTILESIYTNGDDNGS